MPASLQIRSEGRQSSLFAMAEFTFADLAAGTFAPCIKLPAGAAIVQGYLGVKTPSGAALTLSLGTAAAPAGLLAATSVAAVGKTAITAALSNYGCPGDGKVIGITPSAANSTALEGVVVIEYIVSGRSSTTES
jgi:hypothetical protein